MGKRKIKKYKKIGCKMVTFQLDELSFFVFIICFLLYFTLLYSGYTKKTPSKFTIFNEIYRNWVKDRIDDQSPLVGVQALRNFIMGNSTFVSSTVFVP